MLHAERDRAAPSARRRCRGWRCRENPGRKARRSSGCGSPRWSSRRTSPTCSTTRRRACRCRSPCRDRRGRPRSLLADRHSLELRPAARWLPWVEAVGDQHRVASAIGGDRAVSRTIGFIGDHRFRRHRFAVRQAKVAERERTGLPRVRYREWSARLRPSWLPPWCRARCVPVNCATPLSPLSRNDGQLSLPAAAGSRYTAGAGTRLRAKSPKDCDAPPA